MGLNLLNAWGCRRERLDASADDARERLMGFMKGLAKMRMYRLRYKLGLDPRPLRPIVCGVVFTRLQYFFRIPPGVFGVVRSV